jgi:RNA polymerase sigma factor (sigma-70 family)
MERGILVQRLMHPRVIIVGGKLAKGPAQMGLPHRYCARMTGSAIDGDDVVQDVFVKAIDARSTSGPIDNPEGWLFRIAHNAALDFLRSRARIKTTQLDDEAEIAPAPQADTPDADVVAVSFHAFLQLPVLQRCAVILKDVLGHSVEEMPRSPTAGSQPPNPRYSVGESI